MGSELPRIVIRDEAQLRDNLGAVGWNLTAAQVARLDAASATFLATCRVMGLKRS